jgi:hypothetical protein
MKAIELNPKDATSIYSLGYWCFLFADTIKHAFLSFVFLARFPLSHVALANLHRISSFFVSLC